MFHVEHERRAIMKYINGENNQCWYKLIRIHLGLMKIKLYVLPDEYMLIIERYKIAIEPWLNWKEVYRHYFHKKGSIKNDL